MVIQELGAIARLYGAHIDYERFERLFRSRLEDDSIRIPKAMEANFLDPRSRIEDHILDWILEYRDRRAKELQEGLFQQKKRLADAQRKLQSKTTKAALESERIGKSKVEWHLAKLAALTSPTLESDDSRIFPMHYAPVVVRHESQLVIRPMRYHCRPAGKPAYYDKEFDGLYNARRDSLEKFWKDLFGRSHAIVVMTGFYENVSKHRFERRELATGEKEQNVVLNFNPRPQFLMNVACLWSRWDAPGQPILESFAAITDEPPPEVSAAGHDRCVIPLKVSNVNAWLDPAAHDRAELYGVLDDRERPFYEHRLAA